MKLYQLLKVSVFGFAYRFDMKLMEVLKCVLTCCFHRVLEFYQKLPLSFENEHM